MIPGTILFDDQFKFKDGQTGKKLFVVLNDGLSGTYITTKTTSNGRLHGIVHGCQVVDRHPSFLLFKGCCCLNETTWIQLDSFFEFHSNQLMSAVMTNQIKRIGQLTNELTRELLVCVTNAEDITYKQEEAVQGSLVKVNKEIALSQKSKA